MADQAPPPLFLAPKYTPLALVEECLRGDTVRILVGNADDTVAPRTELNGVSSEGPHAYESSAHYRDNLVPKLQTRLASGESCPLFRCSPSALECVDAADVQEVSAQSLVSMAWFAIILEQHKNRWLASAEFAALEQKQFAPMEALDFVDYFDVELVEGDEVPERAALLRKTTWKTVILCARGVLFQKRQARRLRAPELYVSERSAFMHGFSAAAEQANPEERHQYELKYKINGHMYLRVSLQEWFVAMLVDMLKSSVANYKIVGNDYY